MGRMKGKKPVPAALATALLLGGIAINNASAALKVEVKKTEKGPMLYVNGKATPPTVFFVNFEMDPANQPLRMQEVAAAARHGVNLVSIPVYMPWKREGVETDFTTTDKAVDDAIKANPNALIIPRFGVTWPPQWWVEKHPNEMMLFDDGKRQTASVHSRVWRAAAAENVVELVKHLEQKYGDHMLGYHTSGQNTGEWFYDRVWEGRLAGFEPPAAEAFRAYLKSKYKTEAALRLAWRSPGATFDTVTVPTMRQRTSCKAGQFRDPILERRVIDFLDFQNIEMATAVEDMCKAVRTAAPDKITVQFYGYPFELSSLPYGPQTGGHLAMHYLLKSQYLDVVCSPVSYQNRGPGGGGFFMAPVDSVQAHGKLWLVEDDTRTHFAEADAGPGRCNDVRETHGVLARNFGNYTSRGAAVWWMDLMGTGWYQGDELWSFLAGLKNIYSEVLPRIKPYHADIAVILDEKSCLYMEPNRGLSSLLLGAFREQWYRIGAPVGIYLLDDLTAGKVPPARMYLILNAFSLDRSQIDSIRKHACRRGCTVVWMYAPGLIRDGSIEFSNVQDVCKILLRKTRGGTGDVVIEATGESFSAGHGELSPMFAVADEKARVIARYAGTGEAAVASRDAGGYTSVYCGVLQLPASLLRSLAREAGVHIYSDSNDIVAAGNGLISIHATDGGHKTLGLPSDSEVTDAISHEELGAGRSFQFDMKLGDTRIFLVNRVD